MKLIWKLHNKMSLPQVNSLHIELTNICTLKCPGCARTQFINKWPQHWKNHSIDVEHLFNFIDVIPERVVLCGNEGDPIYHKDFHDIIKQFKDRNVKVTIMTNGSYKTADWWQELTDLLTDQDTIIFSIDGMPENFAQYRINGDWDSIKTGIDISVKSKCQTQWKFIPFSYNQDQIDKAEQLSKELGMDSFLVDHSDRFDEHTEHLKPVDLFLGDRYKSQKNWKSGDINLVNPKCANGTQHYISAKGFYTSCCYVADFRFFYKTLFYKNIQQFEIKNTTLSQLLTNSILINFYNTIQEQQVCQFNCPKK